MLAATVCLQQLTHDAEFYVHKYLKVTIGCFLREEISLGGKKVLGSNLLVVRVCMCRVCVLPKRALVSSYWLKACNMQNVSVNGCLAGV